MTQFIEHPRHEGLVKISGTIANYRVSRGRASFVFTNADRGRFGAIAIAASLAGMGGQATSMAGNASALEEEADFVQFRIDGIDVTLAQPLLGRGQARCRGRAGWRPL